MLICTGAGSTGWLAAESSGDLATGEKLLALWDEIPNDSADDKKLIDAWGTHVGLTGWYEFLPYE